MSNYYRFLMRRQVVFAALALMAVLITLTAGPMFTALLGAASLVTWLGSYTSAGVGI